MGFTLLASVQIHECVPPFWNDGTQVKSKFTFGLENELGPHRYLSARERAELVVVEIRISGDTESTGLSSNTSERFLTLIKEVQYLSADLEVKP